MTVEDLDRLVKEFTTPPWAQYRGCPRRLSEFAPEGEFYVLLPLAPVHLGGPPIVEKHTLVCHPKTFEKALQEPAWGPLPPSPDEMTAMLIHAALNKPRAG